MLKVILIIFSNFIFISNNCERYCKTLNALEIDGKIEAIDIDENHNSIVLEINCNNITKKIKLFNNASSMRLYEHAKVGDKLHKDKDCLRIMIARIMSPMHVQVRYFDITCDGSE